MLSYNTTGSCVLVLTLATMLVAVLLLVQQRTGKTVAVWFMSAIVGIVLGAAGYVAIIQMMGLELIAVSEPGEYMAAEDMGISAESLDDESDEEDGGGDDAPAGGGRWGRGRAVGGFTPPPKRLLTSLVRKIDLLTGDISLELNEEQAAKLVAILGRIEALEAMTDDEAVAVQEEILAVLDDTQQSKQDAIRLPFSRGGRGGLSGGEEADETANPFAEEQNATAIQALLNRFGRSPNSAEPAGDPASD